MSLSEIVLFVILTVIDQFSKSLVMMYIPYHESIRIIEGFFYLGHTHNTGIAWSAFSGSNYVFAVLASCVFLIIIWYLHHEKSLSRLERISIIMIASGALGNVIDRFVHGYVIDFLDFYIFGYDYPVFNLADSFIVVGVIIYLLYMLVFDRKK